MIWLRRVGWTVLVIVTLATAAAVYLVKLPEPEHSIVIDHATYVPDEGPDTEITLPYSVFPRLARQPDRARYVAHFDVAIVPNEGLSLFIPTLNRQISLALNGELIFASGPGTLWSGPLVSGSVLVQVPRVLLVAGRNDLTIVLETGQFAVPSYLSKIYLGAEPVLAPYFKMRVLFEDRLKTMALAAHVLLGFGIIFAFFYRPKDPLFAWLAAMVAVSFILSIAMFAGFEPDLQDILPYIAALSPAFGFLAIGVAFALTGVPAPRILRVITVAVPSVSMVFAAIEPTRMLMTLINVAILILAFVAATGVVAWGAFRQGGTEARLMLAPFFLVAWFLIRDAGVVMNLPEQPLILLTPYVRPLFLAALTAVLMRRLGMTLDHLDRANENLNLRLAEQEAELAILHREERIEAARLVREQERQRLTHDLHDGISGHLVSIIAMSERAGAHVKPIEQAAREALDDLRLVIYSLDLGDRELPLALANFRERLIPRLQRIGVELDWSTANLPEVSGVTPGNALTILRILQEAITNALKHGPARKITVRGAAAVDGMVAITVENDGRPFVAGESGQGLQNMRRRASHLRGEVKIECLDRGAKLTLLLPSCLPDSQVAAEG